MAAFLFIGREKSNLALYPLCTYSFHVPKQQQQQKNRSILPKVASSVLLQLEYDPIN